MEQISVNKHGGAFRVGKHYSFEKKVLVMETFHELQRVDLTVKPTISSLAKALRIVGPPSIEGVGGLFRPTDIPMEMSLAEKDSRPLQRQPHINATHRQPPPAL